MDAGTPHGTSAQRTVDGWRGVRATRSGLLSLHRLRWLALALLLLPLAAISTSFPSLSRGPYLQHVTRSSVTVVWRTDAPADCGLDIWPAGTSAITRVDGAAVAAECAIEVAGLRPGRQYAYVPLANGSPLGPPAEFRTDDPNLPYEFLVLGDSGSGDEEQLAIAELMEREPADLIVHTGDMVYPDAVAEEWDPKFFEPYQAMLRRLVLWPCIGNHDVNVDDGESWRDVFRTPANNALGNERYYSFRYGNARFVVLDTYDDLDPGSPQYDFLVREIGASVAAWKFVIFHDTIYSSGEHGSDEGIRADLIPVFDEFGVDLVFMGHDHHYERTWALRGGVIVPAGTGTVYVTTGGGGATVRETGASGFTARAEAANHFLRVAVDGGLLNLEMVRDDGTVGDTLTLKKEVSTEHDVTPVADTYIEAEEEAGFEHGGSESLKVDADPMRIIYLKFDLHRLRTAIRSARLMLFPLDGSADGGTVYTVPDSIWIEGLNDAAAKGPGLKWTDVDTNDNGRIDGGDESPWIPDFTRPVARLGRVGEAEPVIADVTGAFLHRGPGIYTLAIATAAENGASYAAREHETLGLQPQLLLELQDGVCGNGIVEPGEECDQPDCCSGCVIAARGAACEDDGRFCTGLERCDGLGECVSAGDPCVAGGECARGCDEEAKACADPRGTACADDGMFCTEDMCDGEGACVHSPVAACRVVADQEQSADCYAVLAGLAPDGKARVDCRDGDAACDRDGVADGACRFEARVCALQRDLAGCRPAAEPVSVERLIVKPAKVRLNLPPLPATEPVCGESSPLVVGLKRGGTRPGKLTLKLVGIADTPPRRDYDRVVVRCLPAR